MYGTSFYLKNPRPPAAAQATLLVSTRQWTPLRGRRGGHSEEERKEKIYNKNKPTSSTSGRPNKQTERRKLHSVEAQTKIRTRVLRLKHGRAQHLVEGGLCRRETLVCTQIMIPRGDTNGGCSTEVTVTSRKLECRGMVLVLGARNSVTVTSRLHTQ